MRCVGLTFKEDVKKQNTKAENKADGNKNAKAENKAKNKEK